MTVSSPWLKALLGGAGGALLVLGSVLAHAQDGTATDFVTERIERAQAALAACDTSLVGQPRPTEVVRVEVTLDREVTARTLTSSVGPGWRRCIENAVVDALPVRRGPRPRRGGTAVVAITLGTPAVTIPTPATRYVVSQSVEVLWGASWYPATVLRVHGRDRYLIRYDGWSASDEVVGLDRIRPAPGAPPPGPQVTPATPARFAIESATVVAPPPVTPTPPALPGELVTNGSFELPPVPDGGHSTLAPSGWQIVSGPGAEVQANVAGAPAEGRQHLELDSTSSTSISQDLRTRPGQRYEVRLSFAARPGVARGSNRLAIVWGGRIVLRVDGDGVGTDQTRWITVTALVTAESTRTMLELRDEGTSDSVGTYVDDVHVTPAR